MDYEYYLNQFPGYKTAKEVYKKGVIPVAKAGAQEVVSVASNALNRLAYGTQGQQPSPQATKPTAAIPSKLMDEYKARMAQNPYSYDAKGDVVTKTPNAPLDKFNSGISLGGVEQPTPQRMTDPRALAEWKANARVNADVPAFRNGAEAGYVRQAYSNVPGTASIKMGGFAPTAEAMKGGYSSVPTKFTDYKEAIAAMKADPARQVAFKPGERAPLSMNQNQKAQYAEKQRQGEQALSRASQERMTETEAKATIGEAEAKGKSALEVAKAQAEGKVESAGSTTAEEMKAIASALGNVSPETSPDVVKALQARLLALAQGGGQEKLTANPELQKQEALNWASKNPKDPRAIEIMKRYGQKTA